MADPKAGLSSLVFDTHFFARYLHPQYWGIWLAVLLLFLVSLTPRVVQDGLSKVLGDFFAG